MTDKERKIAREVWNAYLAFGPVDDGRPEGERFTRALNELMNAEVESEGVYNSNRHPQRCQCQACQKSPL